MWLALMAHVALANDIRVPDDVATLGEALAAVDDDGWVFITADVALNEDVIVTRSAHIVATAPQGATLFGGGGDYTLKVETTEPVTLEGLTFENPGGQRTAMYLGPASDVTLIDVSCIGMDATDAGGCVRADTGAQLVVWRGLWTNNEATRNTASGGGLYAEGATITVYDTVVDGAAAVQGGAFAVQNGTLTLDGVTTLSTTADFSPNSAITAVHGGAVFAEDSDVTVIRSVLSSARSGAYGGAISVLRGSLTIDGSTLQDNTAIVGAGVFSQNAALSLLDSELLRGLAEYGAATCVSGGGDSGCGGGVVVDGGGFVFQDVVLCGNEAFVGGGAYLTTNSASTLYGVVAQDNIAYLGGGFVLSAGAGTLVDRLTMVANLSSDGDTGAAVYSTATSAVTNSVFAYNSSTGANAATAWVSPARPSGPNNLWWGNEADANPAPPSGDLFVDPKFASFTDNGLCDDDLSPGSGSPLNAGLGAVDAIKDGDSDGFDELTDCNDSDASVHPEAAEVCNGRDDDCDGRVDADDLDLTDGTATYRDGDEDGYGTDLYVRWTCGPVDDHFSTVPGDCDEANDAVHPGAADVPNGVDDDCDGSVDGAAAWCDCDADGFGSDLPASDCATCDPSPLTGDCDDGRPDVYPGAKEVCDDTDNDCDGAVDDDDDDLVGGTTWFTDGDGDGFGDPATGATTCDPTPGAVSTPADCDDLDADVFPGAPERGLGGDDNCDGRAVTAWVGGACGGCDAGGGALPATTALWALLALARRRRTT